jgi:hypothetical protein
LDSGNLKQCLCIDEILENFLEVLGDPEKQKNPK